MSSIPIHVEQGISLRVLRHSKWDALLVALALLQAIVLVKWPSAILIAIGMWWGANTIAHNFIHRPFFVSKWLNRAFSFYLSLVLGIPQSLWRARHLAPTHRPAKAAVATAGSPTFQASRWAFLPRATSIATLTWIARSIASIAPRCCRTHLATQIPAG